MKSDFYIDKISKKQAKQILLEYHYLKDISRGFKSGNNYGLFRKNNFSPINIDGLLGVCIFTGLPVPEVAKSAFGLERTQQQGLFELSRLCIRPDIQLEEYNITSWFVSRCIKKLRKDTQVKAIISYADSQFHNGTIYRACNFKYCGLTDPKTDFWIKQEDGSFLKHSRGKVKGVEGEWRQRSRKHRYVIVFDKELHLRWKVDI